MNNLKSILFVLITIVLGVAFIPNRETQAQSESPIVIERAQVNRHRITCQVNSLEDISVSEGLKIAAGETVCMDSQRIRELEERRNFLERAIASTPKQLEYIPMTLPPVDFSQEETAVTIAQARLTRLEENPPPELSFFNKNDSRIYEPHIFNQYINYKNEVAEARYRLAEAIANLNTARINRKQEEFQISQRNIQNQQAVLLKQQEINTAWTSQKNQLATDMARVNEALQTANRVISPVAGTIHRVRFLDNEGNTIPVEITINVES